jgi:hypothetical protein
MRRRVLMAGDYLYRTAGSSLSQGEQEEYEILQAQTMWGY